MSRTDYFITFDLGTDAKAAMAELSAEGILAEFDDMFGFSIFATCDHEMEQRVKDIALRNRGDVQFSVKV